MLNPLNLRPSLQSSHPKPQILNLRPGPRKRILAALEPALKPAPQLMLESVAYCRVLRGVQPMSALGLRALGFQVCNLGLAGFRAPAELTQRAQYPLN